MLFRAGLLSTAGQRQCKPSEIPKYFIYFSTNSLFFLSALSREFSPFSPLSPREGNEAGNPSGVSLNNSQVIDNNIVSNNNTDIKATTSNFPPVVGKMGKVGKMGETTFFSETFSQLLDVGRLSQKFMHILT